ncbi:MAG: cysteine desulfurase, partial [Thermodesulfobacteria bacterium]|nr:cysteine desulfurase [Thermodesulfobacteriota bacterium]
MPEYIYLDYNATTPLLPEVINEIERTLEDSWGNPSSSHALGKRAKETLETARARVAGLINAGPEEVIFTSGGTESNNLAIIGGAKALKEKGKHLITTRIEHPSVINPFVHLMEEGFEVDFVGPDKKGIVDPQKLATFIRPDTVLCSVMLANNETGALQPISEIGKICRKHDILFHTDAAQAIGKIPVDVKELGVDLLTVAGHKLYAPKGIGALFVRSGVSLERIFFGAGQEMGLRAGTEPVP